MRPECGRRPSAVYLHHAAKTNDGHIPDTDCLLANNCHRLVDPNHTGFFDLSFAPTRNESPKGEKEKAPGFLMREKVDWCLSAQGGSKRRKGGG